MRMSMQESERGRMSGGAGWRFQGITGITGIEVCRSAVMGQSAHARHPDRGPSATSVCEAMYERRGCQITKLLQIKLL